MKHPETSPPVTRSPAHHRIRVLVLAGGQSRRMGADKATMSVGSETLLARACSCARKTGYPVVVAGRDRLPETLPGPFETCADGAGQGPVAGLLGAAASRPGCSWLVIACDLPLLTPDLLLRLVQLAHDHPRAGAVVPVAGGRLHPLCAWYGTAMIDRLRQSALAGSFGLTQCLAARPDVLVAPDEADPVLHADAELLGWNADDLRDELLNCNRPEDLDRAQQILREAKTAG